MHYLSLIECCIIKMSRLTWTFYVNWIHPIWFLNENKTVHWSRIILYKKLYLTKNIVEEITQTKWMTIVIHSDNVVVDIESSIQQ